MKRYIAYLFNNQIVNIMKRNLLLILSIIICNSYAVAAQEIMRNGKAAPDYFSLEVNTFATASNIWSASYWERGYADNMLIGFDLRFGARIRKDWSLFLKTEIPCLVADRYSSQNVISKANLGVGASYIINPADWKVFLQPSISVLSTGFKNADSYLKPDIELRVGINSRFKPYLGLRAEYLYSYNNTVRRHFLYGICFGIILL